MIRSTCLIGEQEICVFPGSPRLMGCASSIQPSFFCVGVGEGECGCLSASRTAAEPWWDREGLTGMCCCETR